MSNPLELEFHYHRQMSNPIELEFHYHCQIVRTIVRPIELEFHYHGQICNPFELEILWNHQTRVLLSLPSVAHTQDSKHQKNIKKEDKKKLFSLVEKTIQFKKENNNEISLQDQIVVQQLAKKKNEDVIDIGQYSQGRRATGLTIHGILLMAVGTSTRIKAFLQDACAPVVQYNENKNKN